MTACAFGPAHEPWSCTAHTGGIRTRLDEDVCSAARPKGCVFSAPVLMASGFTPAKCGLPSTDVWRFQLAGVDMAFLLCPKHADKVRAKGGELTPYVDPTRQEAA